MLWIITDGITAVKYTCSVSFPSLFFLFFLSLFLCSRCLVLYTCVVVVIIITVIIIIIIIDAAFCHNI